MNVPSRLLFLVALAVLPLVPAAYAADLTPSAVDFKTPAEIRVGAQPGGPPMSRRCCSATRQQARAVRGAPQVAAGQHEPAALSTPTTASSW